MGKWREKCWKGTETNRRVWNIYKEFGVAGTYQHVGDSAGHEVGSGGQIVLKNLNFILKAV